MVNKKKYSRPDLIVNGVLSYALGLIIGSVEGVLGSLAVPTSLRGINNRLDKDIDDIFKKSTKKNIPRKVGNLVYHSTRLVTRVGMHATAMYKMVEDLSDKGDISYGLLVIPNLINLGYEIYRSKKKEKVMNFEKRVENTLLKLLET